LKRASGNSESLREKKNSVAY